MNEYLSILVNRLKPCVPIPWLVGNTRETKCHFCASISAAKSSHSKVSCINFYLKEDNINKQTIMMCLYSPYQLPLSTFLLLDHMIPMCSDSLSKQVQ